MQTNTLLYANFPSNIKYLVALSKCIPSMSSLKIGYTFKIAIKLKKKKKPKPIQVIRFELTVNFSFRIITLTYSMSIPHMCGAIHVYTYVLALRCTFFLCGVCWDERVFFFLHIFILYNFFFFFYLIYYYSFFYFTAITRDLTSPLCDSKAR